MRLSFGSTASGAQPPDVGGQTERRMRAVPLYRRIDDHPSGSFRDRVGGENFAV